MAVLAWLYLWVLRSTCRLAVYGDLPTEPAIIVVWHGRTVGLAFMPAVLRRRTGIPISLHRDGNLIAYVARWFGYHPIRGSQKRRGAQALREMLRHIQQGGMVALTPDAPPQKVYTCAGGAADLAFHSQVPVYAVGVSSSRGAQLQSKDRYVLTWPFSRVTLHVSDPLLPPFARATKAERAQFHQQIEQVLQHFQRAADHHTKHPEWSH